MRTLKKVLALSLVFAMAFTMMAGAAFKDQDKIDTSLNDDISLLTALGVFKGDENGNFNPADNVKRSEAAKMIYVLKNNGVDDGAVAFQGVSKYADVPVGHWAEGYINYCTNLGFMGGWQENGVQKFDPNGNVTGVELMKMLLCMIGYKADVQGYTGNGWQTNVLVDAATSGLSVNFTPSVYGATPRQWTARLMVNALNAYWVSYSKGELTYADNTYAQQYMKLYSATGTLAATQTNAIATQASDTVKTESKYSTITDVKYSDDKTDASVDFEYATPNELLGQQVRVYFRGNSTTENVLGTSNKVYGVTASGNQKVVNTTLDAVKFDDKFDDNGKVTIEGLGTKAYTGSRADDTIDVRVNYDLRSNDKTMMDLKDSWLGVNSDLPVKVIADKDGYVKSIMVTGVPVYGVVNKLDAENGVFELKNASGAVFKLKALDNTDITFNKANKDDFAKYLEVASDIKVGDVVECMGTVDGGLKYTVTKATVLGAATGYTVKADGSYKTVKIDGADYKLSALPMEGYDWANNSGVGSHKTFYTDGKYVVYSTGDSAAANVSNMAYLIDGGKTQDAFGTVTLKVKVLLADGTQSSYTLNKKDGLGKTVGDAGSFDDKEDKVYTYSISDNVITLKDITTKSALDGNNASYMKATAAIEYKKDTGIAKVDSVEYRTNDSTIFFVKSGKANDYKYAVVKASELKGDVTSTSNTATDTTFVAQNVNNFKTILAGVLKMAEMPAAEAKDYYFVTGNANYMGKVGDKYVVELPVNAAGEETVLTFKYDSDGSINSDMVTLNKYVGKIVNADLKADGSVDTSTGTGLTVITVSGGAGKWSTGALNAWDDTNASIGGKLVKINKDVKIFNVDVNDQKNAAKLVADNSVVFSEGEDNAVYLTNSDDEIIAIFCEIDGAAIAYVTTAI